MGPWLVDRRVRCVRRCLCPRSVCMCVCVSSEIIFSQRGRQPESEKDTYVPTLICLCSQSGLRSLPRFVLSIKTVKLSERLDPTTYIFWLGGSVLGSHSRLLDGGQIGPSDGQQGSPAERERERGHKTKRCLKINQDKQFCNTTGKIKTLEKALLCHIFMSLSGCRFSSMQEPSAYTIQQTYQWR